MDTATAAAAAVPNADTTTAATAPNNGPVELGVSDIFRSFAMQKKQERASNATTAQGTTNRATEKEQLRMLVEECKDAFIKYISWCETEMDDWHSVIVRYPSKRYHLHSKKWDDEATARFVENCENKNYLEVGLYFDVLAWWQENKTKFPKVFPSALIALTKPPTNAFVERGFSGASHFDSNRLMRRQLPKNFEMRTMDAQTRALRERLMKSEKVLGDLAAAKQAMLEEYNKSNNSAEGEFVATKATTRSIMDLTTYWSRFHRAQTQTTGRPKVQSTLFKFVVDGSKQSTRKKQQTTTATTVGTAKDVTLEIEDEEVTCEVDDQVDLYTMGEADNIDLVDLSYDSDNENKETDEYDAEDNDVVLLQSLQDKLTEEETGVIHVDDRSPYDPYYVDMTADDYFPEPQTLEQTTIPSTPKRKDDASLMSSAVSSASKRSKVTEDVQPRSYTPRKAKEAAAAKEAPAAKKVKKKNAESKKKSKRKAVKAGGKKRIRKVDEEYRSSEEEEEEEEEEEDIDDEEDADEDEETEEEE